MIPRFLQGEILTFPDPENPGLVRLLQVKQVDRIGTELCYVLGIYDRHNETLSIPVFVLDSNREISIISADDSACV